MTTRNLIGTLVIIGVVAAIMFVPPRLRVWRQSRQISREIAWVHDAVQQIQNFPAPATELSQTASTGRWEIASSRGSYLIFSNGWAACRKHSWHSDDGMDDISVLKMSDGNFYLSRYHFEFGIGMETLSRPDKAADSAAAKDPIETASLFGGHSQPADAKDFLEYGGRWQGWYLFSRNAKLQCIVRSPYEDHRRKKKGLWVWIGNADGRGGKTLFQKTYSIFAGRDMTWKANWSSGDEITVEVFDYFGRFPMMMGEDLPARPLATLIFQPDKLSGMFLEKTNIVRFVTPEESFTEQKSRSKWTRPTQLTHEWHPLRLNEQKSGRCRPLSHNSKRVWRLL